MGRRMVMEGGGDGWMWWMTRRDGRNGRMGRGHERERIGWGGCIDSGKLEPLWPLFLSLPLPISCHRKV